MVGDYQIGCGATIDSDASEALELPTIQLGETYRSDVIIRTNRQVRGRTDLMYSGRTG